MAGPWHILTGEYPPQSGGVSDYTAMVARALASAGDDVHVWAPAFEGAAMRTTDRGVTVHRLPRGFDERGLGVLEQEIDEHAGPRTLLVQYVPHAFGARGMNLRFCRWVQHRARGGHDDVRVMFHEPYYPFAVWPFHRNLLALANRVMAVLLLSDLRTAYVSTTAWERRLSKYAPRARRFVWLPIPSSIPVADGEAIEVWRDRLRGSATQLVGHFGTYGRLVVRHLGPALVQLLSEHAEVGVALIGPGGGAFAEQVCAGHPDWATRVTATERLEAKDVAACVAACDVMLQPYADGASGRRTTLMASLINGAAVVTNRGAATEPVWDTSAAVALVGSSRSGALAGALAALLADPAVRERLGDAGRALYADRFALEHTVEALRAGGRGSA